MRETFEIPLDLPDVKIIKTERNASGDSIVTVESTVEGTECRRCGRRITKPYGHDREMTLRHLPILGKRTYIRIRPRLYQCRDCDGRPTTTQKVSWYEPCSEQTKAYEKHILLALVNSMVTDVSLKEDIDCEAVMGIVERHLGGQVNWNEFEGLEVIGVDEIALKKGHRDFVTKAMHPEDILHRIWLVDISKLSEEELWQHFLQCLRVHDWGYKDSKEEFVQEVGRREEEFLLKLKEACSELDAERAQIMFDRYRSDRMHFWAHFR